MVSRRNFISLTLIMLMLLFLFQAPQVIKQSSGDYFVNQYAEVETPTRSSAWQAAPIDWRTFDWQTLLPDWQPGRTAPVTGEGEAASGTAKMLAPYVLYIGAEDGDIAHTVSQWCAFTKRPMAIAASLGEFDAEAQVWPEVLLIDGAALSLDKDAAILESLRASSMVIVYCSLPAPEVMMASQELYPLFGIDRMVAEETEIEGVRLYPNFLLGGEAIYDAAESDTVAECFDLSIPWYVTGVGTKTYMVGMKDKKIVKNETLPAIIWRSAFGSATVFAVNGTFMEDVSGMGILSAMMPETKSYDIYPVLNAQTLNIVNFPTFADENSETLMEMYSQKATALLRDNLWPSVGAIAESGGYKMTDYLTVKQDYASPEIPDDGISFYFRQINYREGEPGLTLLHPEGLTLKDKLAQDTAFFSEKDKAYPFTSVFADAADVEEILSLRGGQLPALRTIVTEPDGVHDVIGYCDDDVTWQMTTSSGYVYNEMDDFRLKCMETALGYSGIAADMHRVFAPEVPEDRWEKLSDTFSRIIITYWKPYAAFDRTTAVECDRRIRSLLALTYDSQRTGDEVTLHVSGADGSSWFILRTRDGEATSISGGTMKKIEKNAYLICAQRDTVTIRLKD